MHEDDDCRELFITQTPSNSSVISLEDNDEFRSVKDDEFRSVKDDKYLDISDVEVEVPEHSEG